MKVSFKTLGCRLNQHETDSLVTSFDKAGYEIVPFKEKSNITIINTCTVTSQSDHKSRNIIQQAIKANPDSKIIVTGCMAEQFKTDLEKIPGVFKVINNKNKSGIVDIIDSEFMNKPNKKSFNEFTYVPVKKSLHTRAAIKIQDGCDNFCTFCIIPSVRGRAISRPVNEIIRNITETIQNGFKEVVITGVNIGRYYHNGIRFVNLLEKILEIPGNFRVRISSLEPDGFGNELISLFENPKLTPHLHLCLQSGSDQILLKMRRMYGIDNYLELANKIKQNYPFFNLTTDIIVGFPGETENHFKDTIKIVEEIGFSHVHTFKYSVRSGTYAERMSNQIDEKIKNKRSEVLRELSAKNNQIYLKSFVGKFQKVLVEKRLENNLYFGYGENYVPVIFEYKINVKNEFINVKIVELRNNNKKTVLYGIVEQKSILRSTNPVQYAIK